MGQSIRKILRTIDNSEAGPNLNGAGDAVGVVTANVEQTGEIFKVNIDCFEESFDYLRIRDLVNVGKTCKRLQQVAGYCFQQNYSGDAICDSKGIRSNIKHRMYRVEHFAPFIQKIEIDVSDDDDVFDSGFEYFFKMRSKFHRLKEIKFRSLNKVRRLKEIPMGKVEVLHFGRCTWDRKFHKIIEHCMKLKRLEIEKCKAEFHWTNRKIPTLEYFKFDPLYYQYYGFEKSAIEVIPKFLELNPNIRKLATSALLLMKNRDKIMAANVKLDDLAIYAHAGYPDVKSVCDLLNALHQRGFYRKLQFYFTSIDLQEHINQLATVNGVVKLGYSTIYSFRLAALTNLEELYVRSSRNVADLRLLPNKLVNLKRIHFIKASIDDIMPFIRQSVKMTQIQICWLNSGTHFNGRDVLDLLALNRERELLPDARKITLCVREEIYLATKWARKETDLGLIRLKRIQSFQWDNDFKLYSDDNFDDYIRDADGSKSD